MIEPEIKLVFASLFLLMWLGDRAHSHAVLPAFVIGLVMSSHYAQHRSEQERIRVVAFAFLTPFFFLKGGMSVSAGALWANLGILVLLFVGKMVPKLLGVYPLAHRFAAPHATFTTLLMSTGLTFVSDRGGGPVGNRADRDRAALLPAGDSPRARARHPPAGACPRTGAGVLAEHAGCPVMIVK